MSQLFDFQQPFQTFLIWKRSREKELFNQYDSSSNDVNSKNMKIQRNSSCIFSNYTRRLDIIISRCTKMKYKSNSNFQQLVTRKGALKQAFASVTDCEQLFGNEWFIFHYINNQWDFFRIHNLHFKRAFNNGTQNTAKAF